MRQTGMVKQKKAGGDPKNRIPVSVLSSVVQREEPVKKRYLRNDLKKGTKRPPGLKSKCGWVMDGTGRCKFRRGTRKGEEIRGNPR